LSGPTWFVKTVKFDDVAFKVAVDAVTVTLLDLSATAAGNPEQRNDVIIYDAFIDVTAIWAGIANIEAAIGLDKGTRNDASGDFSTADPDAIMEEVSIDDSADVAFLQGDAKADKGDLLPSVTGDAEQFGSMPVVDKPRFTLTLSSDANLGTGTATSLTSGELRAYFCIATPVSLDADSGFGVIV
jgi:hypothetical protein